MQYKWSQLLEIKTLLVGFLCSASECPPKHNAVRIAFKIVRVLKGLLVQTANTYLLLPYLRTSFC